MKLLKLIAGAIISTFVRSFHQSCINQGGPFGETVGNVTMVSDFEKLDIDATKDMRVR